MLFAAANKTLVGEKSASMKTKGLNTELLYNLSPSLHVHAYVDHLMITLNGSIQVSDALKTFGLSPGLEYILFAAFDIAEDEFKERLSQFITTEECLELTELVHAAVKERIFQVTVFIVKSSD